MEWDSIGPPLGAVQSTAQQQMNAAARTERIINAPDAAGRESKETFATGLDARLMDAGGPMHYDMTGAQWGSASYPHRQHDGFHAQLPQRPMPMGQAPGQVQYMHHSPSSPFRPSPIAGHPGASAYPSGGHAAGGYLPPGPAINRPCASPAQYEDRAALQGDDLMEMYRQQQQRQQQQQQQRRRQQRQPRQHQVPLQPPLPPAVPMPVPIPMPVPPIPMPVPLHATAPPPLAAGLAAMPPRFHPAMQQAGLQPTPAPHPPSGVRGAAAAASGKDIGYYDYRSKLKSVDAIRQSPGEGLELVPAGFPRGPILGDEEHLVEAVNAWTCNTSGILGGGFHVSLGRSSTPKTQGMIRGVKCAKCNKECCKWNARYQESEEGWVLMGYTPHKASPVDPETQKPIGDPMPTDNHHSHALIESQAELLAKKQGRTIPADALEFGRVMALSGFKPVEIDRGMRKFLADASGGSQEGTWNLDDVRQAFRHTDGEKELDATHLIEELEKRKQERGLEFEARTEKDRLAMVYWECENAMDDWAQGGESNVLLFDPTCNTNKYGLKLACFTSVASTGQTVILACCLVRSENDVSFEWAFRCFADSFRVKPAVLFTDQDKAIANAVETLCGEGQPWEGMIHLLCVFHISKNFYKHIKPLFSTSEVWHRVNSMFWRIAKDSDVHAVSRWDTDWEELQELIRSNSNASDKQAAALKWLDDVAAKRDKWAARYVFGHCTFGIHSTQRAESINAAIKRTISGSMLLTEVNKNLEEYNRTARDRRTVQAHLQALRNARRSIASSSVVRSLEGKLSPYAFKLVLEQEAQALQYKIVSDDDVELESHEMELEEGFVWIQRTSPTTAACQPCDYEASTDRPVNFVVDDDFGLADSVRLRRTSLSTCSCQYNTAFGGLPCRHIIHMCFVRGIEDYNVESIESKWLVVDEAAVAAAREALLLKAYPSGTARAGPSGSSTPTLNSLERFRALMVEARMVSELARESVGTFQQVNDILVDLTRRLQRGLSIGKLDGGRQERQVGGEENGENEEGDAASNYGTDAGEWLCSMGIMRIGCAKPTGAEFGVMKDWLVDKDVMVKWWPKGQGGWFAASVEEYDADNNTFKVRSASPNRTCVAACMHACDSGCRPCAFSSCTTSIRARSGGSSRRECTPRSRARKYGRGRCSQPCRSVMSPLVR